MPDTPPPTSNWFLLSLLAVASNAGLNPPITLNVNGLLISGDLVDGKLYFDNLTSVTTDAFKGVVPQATIDQFDALFAAFRARVGGPGQGSGQSDGPEPTHIYLRNAKVSNQSGAAAPSASGAWWRIRLDAIQGFSLDLRP